jgi:hypothetical protein
MSPIDIMYRFYTRLLEKVPFYLKRLIFLRTFLTFRQFCGQKGSMLQNDLQKSQDMRYCFDLRVFFKQFEIFFTQK